MVRIAQPRNLARHWKWLIAEGVLGIIAGILALAYPGITVLVLALLLGVGLLLQGVLELVAGFGVRSGTPGRGWLIAFGILSAVAGIICLVHPGAGVFAIILGLTVWFAVAGINDLSMAFAASENRGWNIAMGVLGLLAAIILIVQPGLAIGTVAVLAGILFIVRGAMDIGLGMQLRRAKQLPDQGY
jgi:uncharacterized membrane protein HdeD (DUF308 family)